MRKYVTTFALICTIAVGMSGVASGQDLPKPTKAHQLLARDAGAWDCDIKMFVSGPTVPPEEYQGVEKNHLVSGDMYLRTSFKYQMGERGEYEGNSLIGYDPHAKRYVGVWVDNFTSVPSQMNGEYDEQAKTMTIKREMVDGEGRKINIKRITTWLSETSKRVEIFVIVDTGEKKIEIKLMEMLANKRK